VRGKEIINHEKERPAQVALLHSCKYRRLRAPATNRIPSCFTTSPASDVSLSSRSNFDGPGA
jgi:hypothetical protein